MLTCKSTGIHVRVPRTIRCVFCCLTNSCRRRVYGGEIYICAARDASGSGPLDEVRRRTNLAQVGCWRPYRCGLYFIWQSTSRIALIYRSINNVYCGRACCDTDLASNRGHERSRGRTADGPRDDISTSGKTCVCRCV